jgi:AraC family transcriptional regulator of adaptative response / DNA-3-methyladenine glycosylase II
MKLSHDLCYRALKAHDARFDGVFFTAVKTTGIYCRPICRARAPKPQNCTFYETSAEAEANGYRPCLRCRPELAPGYADSEQSTELIRLALAHFDSQQYEPKSVKATSVTLGISQRHLHRIFKATFNVSPIQYLMTQRLLTAKTLLTDTHMSVAAIAFMSGFGSVSRFNATFKKHYRLTPTALRKSTRKDSNSYKHTDHLTLNLAYRPPYNWDMMLAFFSMRAVPGVEWVEQTTTYRRSLKLSHENKTYSGWIQLKPHPDKNLVQVKVSRTLEPVILQVIKRIRIAFDLDAIPTELPLELPQGIRLPGCFDAFEMGTRAILGQQITVKAARTLAQRIVYHLGDTLQTPWPEITHHFPSAKHIASINEPIETILGPLGIIKRRSQSIQALAKALNSGTLTLDSTTHPEVARTKLLDIPGIGPWTAEYLTMRALGWPDAFPATDIGIKHALLPILNQTGLIQPGQELTLKAFEKIALDYASAYQPWRSYLTISLWNQIPQNSKREVNP